MCETRCCLNFIKYSLKYINKFKYLYKQTFERTVSYSAHYSKIFLTIGKIIYGTDVIEIIGCRNNLYAIVTIVLDRHCSHIKTVSKGRNRTRFSIVEPI